MALIGLAIAWLIGRRLGAADAGNLAVAGSGRGER